MWQGDMSQIDRQNNARDPISDAYRFQESAATPPESADFGYDD
jgi:hypothetical protein